MEKFEKFYKQFERPPFAPVFYPTAEEFQDPIEYVAKIRHEAEPYGVVKIVPPESFRPPFAIDAATFEFTPRVQRLNEIEAIVRERVLFVERLHQFWNLQGITFTNPTLAGKVLDLFKLHRVILSLNDIDEIDENKQWSQVAKRMGFKPNCGQLLRQHYTKHVVPFLKSTDVPEAEESTSEDVKSPGEQCSPTMQGRRRAARPAQRMMAGAAPRTAHFSPPRKRFKELESVFCAACTRGDDEERLLICEACESTSMHTYCCDPPLTNVPAGDWRCPKCVAAELSKIGSNFGFYDASQSYSLLTFTDFANKFKTDYFKIKHPSEVSDEVVEKEFWLNIMNTQHTVAVKYGADLITSKVGSGFPRKTDACRGVDVKQRQYYANHPWNLNNLPILKESVLSHIETGISGMMVPWVYVGMCFSTFCWHTEDHWTYSINYNHFGERKVWYGISGDQAPAFEKAVRSLAPYLTSRQSDIFHHMTTAVNPALLRAHGVDVYTVHQNCGEFVITFPRAYHAGFNEGLNFAEAVNFAPIDWLKMGRLCVSAYADVRRGCVFSHDELVLKMVQSCDKLGIAMSLAALDELLEISKRESHLRRHVLEKGVTRSQKEAFEEIPDDARTCRVCNTTLFASAVSCPHASVCLEHLHLLCRDCAPDQLVLKYRYTLDELSPLIARLEQRTTSYFEWRDRVDALFDTKQKPMLYEVEAFLDTARQRKFPITTPFLRLLQCQKECHGVIDRAKVLLNGKVRTRHKTRMQRADVRLDVEGVRTLIATVSNLPCQVDHFATQLQTLLTKIDDWRGRAQTVLDVTDEADFKPEDVKELLDEGEDFDVKMDELELLNKRVGLSEWYSKASDILSWTPESGMESDARWNADFVLKLIADGAHFASLRNEGGAVSRLHAKLKLALTHESSAERFMSSTESNSVEELFALWDVVKVSDWFSGTSLRALREENDRVRDFRERVMHDMSIVDATELADICEQSRLLKGSELHRRVVESKTQLERLTTRLCALFLKPSSYYNLFEIVSFRDDLQALIDGQSLPRSLHVPSSSDSEWSQLQQVPSVSELKQQQQKLSEEEEKLTAALRSANSQRSVSETCLCAMERVEDDGQRVIVCFLCRAKYHEVCCDWDPFLGRMPEGAFLCIRCLRGRRPSIDDVQAATKLAPQNSFEFALLQGLLSRTRKCSRNMMVAITDLALEQDVSSQATDRMDRAIYAIVACEALDTDVFTKSMQQLATRFEPFLAQQRSSWIAIRNRPVKHVPSERIFAVPKRRRSHKENGKRERRRAVQQEETCSADLCLKPSSRQIAWVECEACTRWFHFICVGVTSRNSHTYTCYSCVQLSHNTNPQKTRISA